MIHLTLTGIYAGTILCGASRVGADTAHAAWSPLDNPDFRAKVCPQCLQEWAECAYEDGDGIPDWIIRLRQGDKDKQLDLFP